jgi:tryptophan synthase alpha chain
MKKIEKRMLEVRSRGEKALLSGVPIGYPDLDKTRGVIETYIRSGIDLVEFSMPSLNPFIDTKAIAETNIKALTLEPDLNRYFESLARVRDDFPDEPFCMMAYADIIGSYGVERFVKAISRLEIDSLELPDKDEAVPELAEALDRALQKAGIYRTYILHHPFDWSFFHRIKDKANGFLLLQSVADGAGKRETVAPENVAIIDGMRQAGLDTPIILGYGISNPDRVKEAAKTGADGVIVGTAMMRWIADSDLNGLTTFIRQLKAATLPQR